ncbi:hypothetical protein NLG97_g259 [Lecanicillium saksenae]|uniref:Uncharacterized protein n=1 Tax=Lecanicillium saksenae TaxID=468837 RepID=A0ACC1R793_9HYPO|nr:hypothetical protein NLG97_g259 [Lecanicillium saksenae]
MKIAIFGAAAAVLTAVTGASNVTYGRGSPGCGKKVDNVGDEIFDPQFNVSGIWRAFRTYTPPTYDKNTPMPLILAFHATQKTQPKLAIKSRFSSPKVNPNMIVHYLAAFKRRWYGPTLARHSTDDFKFAEQSLEHLMNNYCIDVDRVYLVGQSGGAGFANILACHPLYSQFFAGMALFGATVYRDLDDDFCKNARLPLPVWEAHGLNDGTSPYWGDLKRKIGAVPAIPDWIRRWARRNDCDPVPRESKLVTKDITSSKYTCQGQFGFVEHIKVANRGYEWMTDATVMDVSPLVINFLQRFVRPGNLTIPLLPNGLFSASGNSTGYGNFTVPRNQTASGNYTVTGSYTGPRTSPTSSVYTLPEATATSSGHDQASSSPSPNPAGTNTSSLHGKPTSSMFTFPSPIWTNIKSTSTKYTFPSPTWTYAKPTDSNYPYASPVYTSQTSSASGEVQACS